MVTTVREILSQQHAIKGSSTCGNGTGNNNNLRTIRDIK